MPDIGISDLPSYNALSNPSVCTLYVRVLCQRIIWVCFSLENVIDEILFLKLNFNYNDNYICFAGSKIKIKNKKCDKMSYIQFKNSIIQCFLILKCPFQCNFISHFF